uniref:trehalose-phosphatase n=1 Tax=uncultured Altererythrobacter sp. TaxID=500840 RepID=UPI0026194FC1|nr:trehalose-phosphatase [uncultured Altererythrobacter sp.]
MTKSQSLKEPASLIDMCRKHAVALFVDFDGTMVEIAAGPDDISVPPNLAQALEALAARMDNRLAVISGRSLLDIKRHLGTPAIARAGSHGAELVSSDGSLLGPQPLELPRQALDALAEYAREEGLRFEAKTHGGALHYRSNPERGSDALSFATDISNSYGLAIKTGKCVVEVVQKGANKGNAVRAFMQTATFAGATPIFIGDDVTDEDGFTACEELGGFGICVGNRDGTAAEYSVPNVEGVYEWLELF